MSSLGNKQVMARNIQHYMKVNGVTATDICTMLQIPAATFSDWINAKTYPRIDRIEQLANYFGITKADLVEDWQEQLLNFINAPGKWAKRVKNKEGVLTLPLELDAFKKYLREIGYDLDKDVEGQFWLSRGNQKIALTNHDFLTFVHTSSASISGIAQSFLDAGKKKSAPEESSTEDIGDDIKIAARGGDIASQSHPVDEVAFEEARKKAKKTTSI